MIIYSTETLERFATSEGEPWPTWVVNDGNRVVAVFPDGFEKRVWYSSMRELAEDLCSPQRPWSVDQLADLIALSPCFEVDGELAPEPERPAVEVDLGGATIRLEHDGGETGKQIAEQLAAALRLEGLAQ